MKCLRTSLSISCYFLLCFLSCCTHIKTPLSTRPDRLCSAQEILAMVSDAGNSQGLKGMAKVKIELPDKKFSAKELIVAQRPYSLRLETLNPLGNPQFFAVTNGEELFLFSPSEKKFYRGTASPHEVTSFIPLSLSLEKLVPIILGSIPLIEHDAEQMSCHVEGDFSVLHLRMEGGKVRQVLKVGVEEQLSVVTSEIYREGEELFLSTQFQNYEVIGGVLFPKKISLFMPRDKTTVTIHYKKLDFLSEIDPAVFRLTPPQGIEVITLE